MLNLVLNSNSLASGYLHVASCREQRGHMHRWEIVFQSFSYCTAPDTDSNCTQLVQVGSALAETDDGMREYVPW